ncbi:voltage-gated sodium channel [Bacillus sp. LL01]|uniref:ion transporter n=1 Tax=Bacillus sp. LL01 TaxID=1665556 RepID=UPI00064CE6B0|nr:ion transporter [Bacillus sp. LL01]KMJ59244.1 voltage-gated sodium channel [Bacillus sp. LL01]
MQTWKTPIQHIVGHRYFTNAVMFVILLNAILIGVETYPLLRAEYYDIIHGFEVFFLWFFTIEIILRILAEKKIHHFFRSRWNLFDFFIVAGVLFFSGTYFISAIRILRVFRVLRAVTVVPSLQRLVTAFLKTIPSLGTIMMLLSLVFYIFAVLGVMFFGEISPEYFGSLHLALVTLFQVITLESWASGIFRPIFAESPLSWVYFVAFILVGTFIVLNLIVGEILNNIQEAKEEETKEEKLEISKKELAKITDEIAELKQLLINKEKNNGS